MKIFRLGESAIVLSEDPPASLSVQRRIWSVARAARGWTDVDDVVPGMNNVTLFARSHDDFGSLEERLRDAWETAVECEETQTPEIEIPVRYGGAEGPDLAFVSDSTGLTEKEVVEAHSGAVYVVYFMGFQPGFAYLGGLDKRLHLERRAEPRARVLAGSVGIAGEQTGVYSQSAPGGWHIIGRTETRMFDLSRVPASLLAPGRRVRFVRRAQ
ncbi:MAG: 5-oxoprolinase subunit PxpB [Candidatus Baltobacteraceae bacterium]